ncbi:MAG: short-chain fatty acyl-CoA regulator family protein [Actinomycetota bacterium]|nr:short-chain fatty acyl-CoA regulator family protein [Actinomycetota bacterium]
MAGEKLFAGARVRELRERNRLTQVRLARDVGVSASYLNQIEHDRRPLTPGVLLRISRCLGVEPGALSTDERARLVAEIAEATADALEGEPVGPAEIRELVARAPRASRALVLLHRRYRDALEQARTLAGDGLLTAYEEVRDFFYDRDNYVGDLDVLAEELVAEEGIAPGNARERLVERLARRHGVEVRELDPREAPEVVRRFDASSRALAVSRELRPSRQAFQLATQVAYLEHGERLDEVVAGGGLASDDARALARIGLASYFAGAVLMPYGRFLSSAVEVRYDVERLRAVFDVGFEAACHRLSTLQRPGARGVPFAFVRVDRAGNMSKRQTASSFHFSRVGGACPLWVVFEAFSDPGRIFRQVAEMPDARRYLWIARVVRSGHDAFGQPGKTFVVGLGCDLRHAPSLVYGSGEGLDERGAATLIGPGCKVCDRPACPQRALPTVGRPLLVDELTSTFAPYTVVPPKTGAEPVA